MAVTGFVYFCPELRLYRYTCKDGVPDNDVDYKFDADELEDAIVTQLTREDGNDGEARFLAHMTGLARVNPHKLVKFDTGTNKIDVVEPADYWKGHDAERDAAEKAEEAAMEKKGGKP